MTSKLTNPGDDKLITGTPPGTSSSMRIPGTTPVPCGGPIPEIAP